MSISGTYECVTKTPMGDQKGDLTIVVDGDTFTGTNATMMGALNIENGKVNGNKLTWTMKMTVPMPMTLEAEAVVEGDTLTGSVKAGFFGTSPLTGKRKA